MTIPKITAPKAFKKLPIINEWFICKRCQLTFYCSRRCQKYDWKARHRIKCILNEEAELCMKYNGKSYAYKMAIAYLNNAFAYK